MISFRLASDGSGLERYTLQVPFQLGNPHSLKIGEETVCFEGHQVQVIDHDGIHLLRLTEFSNEDAAKNFFPKVRGSLQRLIVEKKMNIIFSKSIQDLYVFHPAKDMRGNPNFGGLLEEKDWTHLDGDVDLSKAAVIPEHLAITGHSLSGMKVTLGTTDSHVIQGLVDGLKLPHPEAIVADKRLSVAIESYAASLSEMSQRARVLGLVTTLEALLEEQSVSEVAASYLERLIEHFDEVVPDNADQPELSRLRERIKGLGKESISENLRGLVSRYASTFGETESEARQNVRFAYSVRSKLVHDGSSPKDKVEKASSWLQRAVPAILDARANEVAGSRRSESV